MSYSRDFGDESAVCEEMICTHTWETPDVYHVELKVLDDAGLEGVDTITITVITPEESLDGLIEAIELEEIHAGISTSLIKHLENARAAPLREDNNAARNLPVLFIHEVLAQEERKYSDLLERT